MNVITSVNNELVKSTVKLQQRKYRDESGLFLLEGFKPIEEAFNSGLEIKYTFVKTEKKDKYSFLKSDVFLTNDIILKKISTTESAPDAVAVCVKKKYSLADLYNSQKVVLLEDIKDLGNLGTILRTSVAFGADAVVLFGETADLYNPKCVRSAVGNLWKIPVVSVSDIGILKEKFLKFQRIATLPRASTYLKDFKPKSPLLVMFGSESSGLSDELINFATDSVKIEMAESVESLNLSVSCSVVLYKMFIV